MARIAMKDILDGSYDHHFRSSAKHLGLSPSGVPQAKRSLGKWSTTSFATGTADDRDLTEGVIPFL